MRCDPYSICKLCSSLSGDEYFRFSEDHSRVFFILYTDSLCSRRIECEGKGKDALPAISFLECIHSVIRSKFKRNICARIRRGDCHISRIVFDSIAVSIYGTNGEFMYGNSCLQLGRDANFKMIDDIEVSVDLRSKDCP